MDGATSLPEISPRLSLAVAAALALGLWADMHAQLPGQVAIGIATWGVLLALIAPLPAPQRWLFLACVAIATAGELFLSLGWGLYTYRLENVPMFVPPGHALMLMLGIALAARLPATAANAILGGAGVYALAAAAAGLDTLGVPLALVLAVAVLALPGHRRLFASTFVLCLGLELYGTRLGNWSWHGDVPWVGLVTTNPPGVAGAFYAALDALVVATLAMCLASGRRADRFAVDPPRAAGSI